MDGEPSPEHCGPPGAQCSRSLQSTSRVILTALLWGRITGNDHLQMMKQKSLTCLWWRNLQEGMELELAINLQFSVSATTDGWNEADSLPVFFYTRFHRGSSTCQSPALTWTQPSKPEISQWSQIPLSIPLWPNNSSILRPSNENSFLYLSLLSNLNAITLVKCSEPPTQTVS